MENIGLASWRIAVSVDLNVLLCSLQALTVTLFVLDLTFLQISRPTNTKDRQFRSLSRMAMTW